MKRKSILTAIAILFIALSSIAQSSKESKKKEDKQSDLLDFSAFKGKTNSETSTFTDSRDGKTYKTVKIGTQTWMAENLAFKAESGCWAYDDKGDNVTKYGYLYDWETAKTACPKGWHLPSDAEWITLISCLGGEDVAGKKMKSTTGWSENGNGTNTNDFTGLPGGCRDGLGKFSSIDGGGLWWSSTEDRTTYAWYRYLYYSYNSVGRSNSIKMGGLSVRCLKD